MTNNVLEVANLRTCFGSGEQQVVAVDDVSFTIGAGEVVGIVGESGCGKSVTASSILRLVPHPGYVAGGTIRFNGRDVMSMSTEELRSLRGNGASMIVQDPMSSLNPVMTVGAQTAEAMIVHGAERSAARARAAELISQVHIPDAESRAGDYPHQFSGGMRQRVMIAMGLANEPSLLIADEPTTALDVTVQAQIVGLLDELNQTTGTAIMLITHNVALVAQMCSRVVVMYAGRIVEQGPTSQVLTNPQHPYTWSLLRAAPRVEGSPRSRLLTIEGMPPNLAAPPPGCRFEPRCPFAVATCSADEPSLENVDEADHDVRCWRPMATIPRTERPDAQPATSAATVAGPARQDQPLLQVDTVSKTFELRAGAFSAKRRASAVDRVSLDVWPGETLGIVGESGCGKSTLGRMILRLEPPTSGRIVFDGQDVTTWSARRLQQFRRSVQIVFQDSGASVDPRQTVADIVAEPLRNVGVRRSEVQRQVREILELCGLPARFMRRYPHEVSGGQRQRIGIARALVLRPRLVVADEPVSALDVSVQAQIVNLLQDLQRELDLTYIFISHDLSVVHHIADRVAVMYLGKIVEMGPAQQIYENPRHPYTQTLLAAIPRLDTTADPAGGREHETAAMATTTRSRSQLRVAAGEIPSPLKPPSGCRFHPRCPIAELSTCSVIEPELDPVGDSSLVACHLVGVS